MKSMTVVARKLGASPAEQALTDRIIAETARRGQDVLVIPDLYHVDDESPVWAELRALTGRVTLWGWQHPRPLRWVLARHGVAAEEWRILDLRTVDDAAEVVFVEPQGEEAGDIRQVENHSAARWYPVIDGERCEQCGHCLQFCLFGVYEHDGERHVRVVQPDACKDGCPACARVCPNGAIMFPLYDADPAIAGAPGTTMSPDAAARRMYYERTGKPCPTCSQLTDDELARVAADGACPECGRELPTNSPVLQEMDALIDRLDDLAAGARP